MNEYAVTYSDRYANFVVTKKGGLVFNENRPLVYTTSWEAEEVAALLNTSAEAA